MDTQTNLTCQTIVPSFMTACEEIALAGDNDGLIFQFNRILDQDKAKTFMQDLFRCIGNLRPGIVFGAASGYCASGVDDGNSFWGVDRTVLCFRIFDRTKERPADPLCRRPPEIRGAEYVLQILKEKLALRGERCRPRFVDHRETKGLTQMLD